MIGKIWIISVCSAQTYTAATENIGGADPSQELAKECSPRRKSWVAEEPTLTSLGGRKSEAQAFSLPHRTPTLAVDQLLTNSPSRPSASGNLSVTTANPSRKCDEHASSKQSPGASNMPCSAAA